MFTRSQLVRFVLIPVTLVGTLGAGVAVAGNHLAPGGFSPEARHEMILDHLEQLADELGLTDGQVEQIKTIAQDAKVQGEALRAQHDGLRDAGIALFAADTLDPDAIEAHRMEVLQVLDDGTALFSDTAIAIGEVLTPEQRRALATKAEQFHAGGGWRERIRSHWNGGALSR